MLDPLEGLTPDGLIRTGARRDRIPGRFRPALDSIVERVRSAGATTSIYVYGSVATGVARSPESDVDLLAIGLPPERARQVARSSSAEFAELCRGVEIAVATEADFHGDGDAAYGGRLFLHHYCVHLAGPDLDRSVAGYPGDQRAARGLNGDIARHLDQWRRDVGIADPAELGRRVARKTLLAVAGLVSVHDGTWTTDRRTAARRWRRVHPPLGPGLDELVDWSAGTRQATPQRLASRLVTTVDAITEQFAADVGLWPR